MKPKIKAAIMDAGKIRRVLLRLATEILERNRDLRNLVVIGIPTRGLPLARRIAGLVKDMEGVEHPRGGPGHLAVPRRPRRKPRRTGRPQARAARGHRQAGRHPGGRRAVHRPDHPGGHGLALRHRPGGHRAASRPHRPRPPRAAHPGRLRGQGPAHLAPRDRPGPAARDRQGRRSPDRRAGGPADGRGPGSGRGRRDLEAPHPRRPGRRSRLRRRRPPRTS